MSFRVECRRLTVAAGDTLLLPETTVRYEAPGLIALSGANGAGKTTLLKVLAGRLLPTSGECLINSAAPNEFDPGFRAAVASLIDTPPMARDLTLTEQLALVRVSWGAEGRSAFETAEQTLSRIEIGELGGRFPYELSSGQLQLFAIALTLSRPFGVLLLDEPERHLDGRHVQTLLSRLEEVVDDGTLVITATHRHEIFERATGHICLDASTETDPLPEQAEQRDLPEGE